MVDARLRLFAPEDSESGPPGESRAASSSQRSTNRPEVEVRASDLFPILASAWREDYLWTRDFLDDRVRISSDLYEVIQAFSALRPPA